MGRPSCGLHTNGYTLARAIVARAGDPIDVLNDPRPELRGGTLAEALMEVHRSYLEEVRTLRKVAAVRSIAHITGGGWEGNLPRALPAALGATIDRAAWTVPPLFTLLGRMGDVPEAERWDTWNMGIGLVAMVPATDAPAALRVVPGAVLIGRVEAASGPRRVRWA
jgi:phosphoribosylformylglycinamidine cyclo-ligase